MPDSVTASQKASLESHVVTLARIGAGTCDQSSARRTWLDQGSCHGCVTARRASIASARRKCADSRGVADGVSGHAACSSGHHLKGTLEEIMRHTARRRDPAEAARLPLGISLLVGLIVMGAWFQLVIIGLPHLVLSKHAHVEWLAMGIGALLAVPFLLVYVWVPWIVDRYDPKPVWALLLCLAWGAFGAGGWSLMINSVAHVLFGDLFSTCLCAPFVEELTKGSVVFFMFYFMRRDFDGVVDGVVYGTFAALGFACFENIVYYSRAATDEMLTTKEGLLFGQVIFRGVLKPWGHPLYTAITGLGIGIARETNKRWLRWLAPMACFSAAVFLHALWNTSAMLAGALLILPLFFLLVLAFFALVLVLVRRKGKIIKDHLRDEVLMGNLTPWELELVTSPIARIRATFSYGGAAGRRFVAAASRLALSKWHTARAAQGRQLTVSCGMILPLRQELHGLRTAVSVALRRPVLQPRPWSPPAPTAYPRHANPWSRGRHETRYQATQVSAYR